MKKVLFLLISCVVIAGCSAKVVTKLSSSYPALDSSAEVCVLDVDMADAIIKDAQSLGTIQIGDSGFTSREAGSWSSVLELAKAKARLAGGNVVRITSHIPPGFNCTTHRITAEILRVPDVNNIDIEQVTVEHPDYAVVYFYRNSALGALISYDVHIGDTPVFRASVNKSAEVKIYEPGVLKIWGKTETTETLDLNVKMGEDYYVRCEVSYGVMVGRPHIELVHPLTGKGEYNALILK